MYCESAIFVMIEHKPLPGKYTRVCPQYGSDASEARLTVCSSGRMRRYSPIGRAASSLLADCGTGALRSHESVEDHPDVPIALT